jgi:guanine nucleotide-binding protein subunit beta-2-like 1 protein
MSDAKLTYQGKMSGHRDWVTSLVCPQTTDSSLQVVSGSRDNTIVAWAKDGSRTSIADDFATPVRRLEGHTGFVQDVALTNNAEYALSASWDRSLRLWNLKTGACFGKFLGHTKDVLSTAFSPDNRHILSGGRDGKLKIWNVKGECVYTLEKDCHTDWVSCVRFSPAGESPLMVSGGWDNVVKVWSLSDFRCMHTLRGHTGYINAVTVSPDGSLCASAGKDGCAKLWDLNRGESLYELTCGEVINQLSFSPNRYWLCAATESMIRIWDLEAKKIVAELVPPTEEEEGEGKKKAKAPECLSVAWSADGVHLFAGFSDNVIRVWSVQE